MLDKHKSLINYLLTCPIVKTNPLFFNFGEAKENNTQFIATSNTEQNTQTFIDGSESKLYNFTLLTYKTISYNAIVKTRDFSQEENILELSEFQEVIDWINEQERLHIYPDFGEDCIVDSIQCTTANPELVDVDSGHEPSIATYSITIVVEYLDNSNKLWK